MRWFLCIAISMIASLPAEAGIFRWFAGGARKVGKVASAPFKGCSGKGCSAK